MADESISPQEQEIDWNRTRQQLRAAVRAQLGRCDPALLEDLTQEALVDLLRVVRREPVRKVYGLAAVIARNVAISEIRRQKRFRLRFADWDRNVVRIVNLPDSSLEDWDDSLRVLWFLLLEFFRIRKASCLELALAYGEAGDWEVAAEKLGLNYAAARKQWSRCTGLFRDELRRDPGPFREWLGGDV